MHKIRYKDEPMGDVKIVDDFLPTAGQLVLKDDGVKVIISLSKRSVPFFKAEAAKSKTSISV